MNSLKIVKIITCGISLGKFNSLSLNNKYQVSIFFKMELQ